MATASTRGKNTPSAQPLALLMWQDTLVNWGIPLLLIGAAILIVVLGAFAQIASPTGISTLGCLLLLLIGFFLFKPLLVNTAESRLKLFTWGFAVAWLLITCTQLYFAVFVGQELTSSSLSPDSGGMTLTLGAQGTVYDLVVEGSFAAAVGEVGREAGYSLELK